MNLRGQDKGRGPKWPKLLSAHHFSRDARVEGRDVDLAQSPIGPKKKAGTWIDMVSSEWVLELLP